MKFINKYKSPNFNKRNKGDKIIYIILHYTAMDSDIDALEYLIDKKNKVSSHFLINKSGNIFNIVNLKYRAWHAGKSYWKGDFDINSKSIGIELDNSGYESYKKGQIQCLINLLNFLIKKYNVNSNNILAHSDVAPYRKIDPGEEFPWKKLSRLNISILPNKISKKAL